MSTQEPSTADVPTAPSPFTQFTLFAKNFIKHPKMLGSVVPSSRFLIDRLLKDVDWMQADVIVEYGPGVGTFTREILRRMHPDAQLLVLETNPDFVRHLRASITDPRLELFAGSATEVQQVLQDRGLGRADYVIAGIPFSTLPGGVRSDILQATHDVLQPEGQFLVYQFSPIVTPHLRREFSSVRRGFELLNVPPAQVYYCAP
jgi:phospholipid N-methyltransferase